MLVRWASAAIVTTEKQFRHVQGWRDIKRLVRVLAGLEATEEATGGHVAWHHHRSRRSDMINGEWDDPGAQLPAGLLRSLVEAITLREMVKRL